MRPAKVIDANHLGPDIDQLAGGAPAVFVEIGDADVVLPTFLVDVGP